SERRSAGKGDRSSVQGRRGRSLRGFSADNARDVRAAAESALKRRGARTSALELCSRLGGAVDFRPHARTLRPTPGGGRGADEQERRRRRHMGLALSAELEHASLFAKAEHETGWLFGPPEENTRAVATTIEAKPLP